MDIYQYSIVLPIERPFVNNEFTESLYIWLAHYWYTSIIFSFVYILLIFWGKWLMCTRSAMKIEKYLMIWNASLALFSITGTIRLLPYFLSFVYKFGFIGSICTAQPHGGIHTVWFHFFTLSKLVELIDTLFLVLRKREVVFLHWYHHSTVLIYSWFSYRDEISTGIWFIIVNYFVHSLMYSYYFLKSLKVRIPIVVSKTITTLQLSQMVVGVIVNVIAYNMKSKNHCHVTYENLYWSFFMYFTYFLLFFHFFWITYMKATKQLRKELIVEKTE